MRLTHLLLLMTIATALLVWRLQENMLVVVAGIVTLVLIFVTLLIHEGDKGKW